MAETKVKNATRPMRCRTLRRIFRRDAVHIPIPFGWVAEFHEMYAAVRRLHTLLAEMPPDGKPKILSKWERA